MSESLIVLSDVHLGSDLVTRAARRRSRQVDDDLVRLIDHYREQPSPCDRWRLVIAGDLIDFIGITLPPEHPDIETAPSEEERAHGLGNARDHTLAKMRAVAERHRDVFDALGRFVADGHALTIIHGNHDLELHWQEVRDELTAALLDGADRHAADRGEALDREAFLGRLEYSPWFFYRDGVAYIEHGHQYDAYCATEHLLTPLSPLDPRRVARGFCDVLLRFVVRQTPGIAEHGHEELGIVDYLKLGARLGAGGMLALFLRYVRAVIELFKLRREHLADAAAALRARHERAMAKFARARKVGVRRVRALYRLRVPPITTTVSGILSSLLVDRLALALGCVLALSIVAAVGIFEPLAWTGAALVLAGWVLGHRALTKRRPKVDAVTDLARQAGAVASIFEAPFIVMGHTHVPARKLLRDAVTYINVGSWAEEEDDVLRAPRSHLVIHPGDDGPVARLLRWDGERGPTEFDPS